MSPLSFSAADILVRARENWKSGLTVALISVPLSIALSIASGAGPLPGLIAGIWGTLIGSLFVGSQYNIIGAAGALSTILFTVSLTAPLGLGAQIFPLLAIMAGVFILAGWFLKLDRFLCYVPSSVMYGFAAGVAVLIAASQLFDATGLSTLERSDSLVGNLSQFIQHLDLVDQTTVVVFGFFLLGILFWKRSIKNIPAVLPAAVIGIIFGYAEKSFFDLNITSLQDKFGVIPTALYLPVEWLAYVPILTDQAIWWEMVNVAGTIALIAVLETLITAKLGDKLTKTESSSSRELLGLSLANIGSGVMGGLPTTGVFVRTGANIKAGATHRTSGVLAAIFTALIALLVLPLFSYIPMAVIAAILVSVAIGLLEVEKFKEFWVHERSSFVVAALVSLITIFHDAGLAVGVGVLLALFLFARRIAHGRFDVIWNFVDGTNIDVRGGQHVIIPDRKAVNFATYSIAGTLGYVDASRHYSNFKAIAQSGNVKTVIIRLRDLFSLDMEGVEALASGTWELRRRHVIVYVSSAADDIKEKLLTHEVFAQIEREGHFTKKTSIAISLINDHRSN